MRKLTSIPMNQEQLTVQMYNLGPECKSFIGLPFVVQDESLTIYKFLYDHLEPKRVELFVEEGNEEEYQPSDSMFLLIELNRRMHQQRHYLAHHHDVSPTRVEFMALLSPPILDGERYVQRLTSALYVKLNDAKLAYRQPIAEFVLNDEQDDWIGCREAHPQIQNEKTEQNSPTSPGESQESAHHDSGHPDHHRVYQ